MAKAGIAEVALGGNFLLHLRSIESMKCVTFYIGCVYAFAPKNLFKGFANRSCTGTRRAGNCDYWVKCRHRLSITVNGISRGRRTGARRIRLRILVRDRTQQFLLLRLIRKRTQCVGVIPRVRRRVIVPGRCLPCRRLVR